MRHLVLLNGYKLSKGTAAQKKQADRLAHISALNQTKPKEWTYLVEQVSLTDEPGTFFPVAAMRHEPSGVTFFMSTPINGYRTPLCSYNVHTAKRGRGWKTWKMEERARAEYERLLAAGEIAMRCEFCRVEGRAFIRGLCPDCSLLCWQCGAPATVSEMPSESYRAGDGYAVPPATYCTRCLSEAVAEKEAAAQLYREDGITDADIPF